MSNRKLTLALAPLAVLLIMYGLTRLLYLLYNWPSFRQAGLIEILAAFLIGVRFDIAAICRINAPYIVLALLPCNAVDSTRYRQGLKILFLVSNVPFLLINIVDFEYNKFTGQRASLSLLDMKADLSDQFFQLSYHYWHLAVIALVFTVSLVVYIINLQKAAVSQRSHTPRKSKQLVIFVLIITLAIIGGRGGLQRRRLTVALAAIGDNENLSQLALNSTYTMINSNHKCDGMNPLHYFETEGDIRRQFRNVTPLAAKKTHPGSNVVIIIVESLSAEYTGIYGPGPGYTPFLDSLARRGMYWRNSFANGRRSIDAPPAILAGLPHLRDETFFCTQNKHLLGLGTILKQHGYNTSFFHGGKNGTMYFDVFSLRMGFDKYYGLNEYPALKDSDGVWGIYDEPFLQYFARELSQRPQPFAAVAFTLSTHNPYKVPPEYEASLPKGELPIHRTVAYFDQALQKFFALAEKQPWYSNTLFIITGDHIGPTLAPSPRMLDNYRVPLVLFHPGQTLPRSHRDKIVQHVDLTPTVLDYLGIATDRSLPFGHSIFDTKDEGLAFGQKAGKFWLADKKNYLEYFPGQPSRLYSFDGKVPRTNEPEMTARLEARLKAYLQWFNNGLATDNLYH